MISMFYIFLTTIILFLLVIFCIAYLRYWLLGREDYYERGESWGDYYEKGCEDAPFPPIPFSDYNSGYLGIGGEQKDEMEDDEVSSCNGRKNSNSRRVSIWSRSPRHSHDFSAVTTNKSRQYSESSTSISSPQPTATLFLERQELIFEEDSEKEDFFTFPSEFPSHRQSFKYKVNMPKQDYKKRRSLPEILYSTIFRGQGSRKNSNQNTSQEIVIQVEDFDEINEQKGFPQNVGLKGCLALPVCDESPTTPDHLEMKSISESQSGESFTLQMFLAKRQETLI